jgi:hypothetical protein
VRFHGSSPFAPRSLILPHPAKKKEQIQNQDHGADERQADRYPVDRLPPLKIRRPRDARTYLAPGEHQDFAPLL